MVKTDCDKAVGYVKTDCDKAVGYVKCTRCGGLFKSNGKRTGDFALQQHIDRGCKVFDVDATVENYHWLCP